MVGKIDAIAMEDSTPVIIRDPEILLGMPYSRERACLPEPARLSRAWAIYRGGSRLFPIRAERAGDCRARGVTADAACNHARRQSRTAPRRSRRQAASVRCILDR